MHFWIWWAEGSSIIRKILYDINEVCDIKMLHPDVDIEEFICNELPQKYIRIEK